MGSVRLISPTGGEFDKLATFNPKAGAFIFLPDGRVRPKPAWLTKRARPDGVPGLELP